MAEVQIDSLKKLQGMRGMADLLPEDTKLWQQVEATAKHHFELASIPEIRTPLLEVTELFSRGIGQATDVVGKEMYSFLDRGDRSCTLRPEGTASVVRAAIQHGLISQGPQKFWYAGPMFRYERPQAGRQRQFHQIGVEYLGFESPRSDVEVIATAWDLLNDLGLNQLTLEINSLGNKNDRLNYRNNLVLWLEERIEKLDPDSQERLYKNPLRILDSKNASTQSLLKGAPKLIESLSSESKERFDLIESFLTELAIPYKLNPQLVRGLDYYSHTAFEITSNDLGAQATICGGGRYDGLVQQLGGPPTPAIGWALGMERLVLLLSKKGSSSSNIVPKFFVVCRGEKAESMSLIITRGLRSKNFSVELDLSGAAFSKQLKRANRCGARWAIIIGEEEANQQMITLKDLSAPKGSKEELISINTLLNRFA